MIYCCDCSKEVDARLTNGKEIYPHRKDLYGLPFWKCDTCGNYVGCHHKTSNPTQPLGVIPSDEIREYRKILHALIDPIWKNGIKSRRAVYKAISNHIGRKYHTANIRTADEAEQVIKFVKSGGIL